MTQNNPDNSTSDTVGNELKELNAAYKNLKQQGDDYVSGNSFDEGRLSPLLGASKVGETWDEKLVPSANL